MSKTRSSDLYRGEPRIRFSSFLESLCRHDDAIGRNDGASRDRTDDLKLAKLALSQLSYGPPKCMNRGSFHFVHFVNLAALLMVGREGVEPSTSRLSGVRSNHLSYRPPCLAGLEAAGGVSQLRLRLG